MAETVTFGGFGSDCSEVEGQSDSMVLESDIPPSLDVNGAMRVAEIYARPAAKRDDLEPAALRVLATLALLGGNDGITRGALLARITESGGKVLAASTGFGAITQLYERGLIDVLNEMTPPHRVTGRSSHKIRINAHGRRVIDGHAMMFRALELAAASRASPTSNLN